LRLVLQRLRRLGDLGRIVADDAPYLGLPERPVQYDVDELDGARCQPGPVQARVECRQIGRLQFLQQAITEVRAHLRQSPTDALGTARAHVAGDPVALEAIEELLNRDLVRLDRTVALRLGDQARGLDLRLPLGADKGMPATLALAGLRIARIEDDRPVA